MKAEGTLGDAFHEQLGREDAREEALEHEEDAGGSQQAVDIRHG